MIIPTETGKGRYYPWDGSKYISVTTAIGDGIPKPGLNRWFLKNMAEIAAKHRKKVAGMTKAEAKQWLLDKHYDDKDNTAANLGSLVHGLCERISLGQTPTIPEEAQPYIDSFNAFLDKHSPEFIETESTVFSRVHGYAGTMDSLFVLDGKTYIADIKTGKAVWPEAALQLSAYRYADFIGRPNGVEDTIPKVNGGLVLHVRPDGCAVTPVDIGPDTFDTFLSALDIFRWLRIDGKHAIGEVWE